MASFERRIDALGGVAVSDSDYDRAYNEGHSAAVEAATEIGADADAVIDELIETVEAILRPSSYYFKLKDWTDDAETLISRIKGRLA